MGRDEKNVVGIYPRRGECGAVAAMATRLTNCALARRSSSIPPGLEGTRRFEERQVSQDCRRANCVATRITKRDCECHASNTWKMVGASNSVMVAAMAALSI